MSEIPRSPLPEDLQYFEQVKHIIQVRQHRADGVRKMQNMVFELMEVDNGAGTVTSHRQSDRIPRAA